MRHLRCNPLGLKSLHYVTCHYNPANILIRTYWILQTDAGWTDGRCAMTIAHSSFRLRWATNETKSPKRTIYRAPEYNVPPFWRICYGDRLVFLIGTKTTLRSCFLSSLVEFHSLVPEEVENVSANQRPRWPICFSDCPEKYKLGRRRSDLASN